jgi:hypothetical protein
MQGILMAKRPKPGKCVHCLKARLYTSGDELAGGDHRGMTDDGDVFTLAARLHAQNAEAFVFVMVCVAQVIDTVEELRK